MAVIFNGEKIKLTMLFSVIFNDGFVYKQNKNDVSISDPLKSCMTDVFTLEEEHKGIKQFILEGEGHTYSLELATGLFIMDGVSYPSQQFDVPVKRELIHYRRHQHSSTVGVIKDSIGNIVMGKVHNKTHNWWYYFGWQVNLDGKNYHKIVNVYPEKK